MNDYLLPTRPWLVTTTKGTVEVEAKTAAAAILSALELTGPNSSLIKCLRHGEW